MNQRIINPYSNEYRARDLADPDLNMRQAVKYFTHGFGGKGQQKGKKNDRQGGPETIDQRKDR